MEASEDIIDICFKEMFFYVGECYPNKKLMEQKDWYLKREWEKSEWEKFREWMTRFLMKSLKFSKKRATDYAFFFDFQYGWKQKNSIICKGIKN